LNESGDPMISYRELIKVEKRGDLEKFIKKNHFLIKAYGPFLLMSAIEAGSVNIVTTLLKYQAPLKSLIKEDIPQGIFESQLPLGTPPLMFAVQCNQLEIVKALIQAGAEEDWKNKRGMTPRMIAERRGYQEIAQELKKAELRREASHFLGIDDQYIGHYDAFSLFTHKLDQYVVTDPQFKEALVGIKEAFHATLNTYVENEKYQGNIITHSSNTIDISIFSSTLKKRYDEGKLIIIPSGWPEHAITLAAIGDLLIWVNLGDGMLDHKGIIIYTLKQFLTKIDIQNLLNGKYSTLAEQSKKTLLKKIQHLTNFEVGSVLHKGQKWGNCEIANKKKMVSFLLTFLPFLSIRKKETFDLKEWEEWLNQNNISARNEYKRFSHFTRTLVLSNLLSELRQIKEDSPEPLLEALAGFCNAHVDIAKESECRLLFQVTKGIPKKYWEVFLKKLNSQAYQTLTRIKAEPLKIPILYCHLETLNEILLYNLTIKPYYVEKDKVLDIRNIQGAKASSILINKFLLTHNTQYYEMIKSGMMRYSPFDRIHFYYFFAMNQIDKFEKTCSLLEEQLKIVLQNKKRSEMTPEEINHFLWSTDDLKENWEILKNFDKDYLKDFEKILSKSPNIVIESQKNWHEQLKDRINKTDQLLHPIFNSIENTLSTRKSPIVTRKIVLKSKPIETIKNLSPQLKNK